MLYVFFFFPQDPPIYVAGNHTLRDFCISADPAAKPFILNSFKHSLKTLPIDRRSSNAEAVTLCCDGPQSRRDCGRARVGFSPSVNPLFLNSRPITHEAITLSNQNRKLPTKRLERRGMEESSPACQHVQFVLSQRVRHVLEAPFPRSGLGIYELYHVSSVRPSQLLHERGPPVSTMLKAELHRPTATPFSSECRPVMNA